MRKVSLALWVLLLGILAAPGSATVVLYRNLDQLIADSDGVVLGTVLDTSAAYSPRGEIYTFVVLGDLEVLAGSYEGSELVLRQRGGEMPEQALRSIGAPRFEAGERVLLFLDGNGRMLAPFVGMSQGVLKVDGDAPPEMAAVWDADGNRVLGIAGSDLARERHVSSELIVLGGGEPRIHAGTPTDGRPSLRIDGPSDASGAAEAGAPPLTLEELAAEIRHRDRLLGRQRSPLESVELYTFPEGEGRDVGPLSIRLPGGR